MMTLALGLLLLDATSPRCAAPEFRQFDFWAGDWDAFDVANHGKLIARNHVDVILDGCVLREVYDQGDGLTGHSFSIYDASRKVWHHTWVTNRGQLLTLEGGLQGDRMFFAGTDVSSGSPVSLRAWWKRENGGVRETAETSADGGKTWQPLFDVVFRAHEP